MTVAVKQVSACISVADLDEAAAWYGRELGFTTVQSMDFPQLPARVAYLESNGARIELVEDPHFTVAIRPDPPHHAATQGVTQLTLYVDDLDAVVDWVTSRGIETAMAPVTVEDLGLRSFFIRDNESNLIEFIQTGGESR